MQIPVARAPARRESRRESAGGGRSGTPLAQRSAGGSPYHLRRTPARPVFAPNIPPRSRGYSMRALRNATALALVIPSILGAQRRAFVPADWYRLTTVSSPAMSPDGKLVAF